MGKVAINHAAAWVGLPGERGSWWGRIVRFLASRREHLWATRRNRGADIELADLPDYLLADIGLQRDQLADARPRWLPDFWLDSFVDHGPYASSRSSGSRRSER